MIRWKLKTRSLRPIGLDIGHSSIKMIQLATNEGQISVIAADKVRIDPCVNGDGQSAVDLATPNGGCLTAERKNFVVSAIKQMLERGSFRGRDVISCLPNERLKITSLRLAEADSAETEQSLKKEASQRFGMDPDKDVIDYILAGSVRQGDEIKNEMILFAADNETIKSHIEMLEEAQLRPAAIDTLPCALFRSFERTLRRQEDKEHTVVFVDVGSRFTTVVFGRGGEISFVKQIPIGGEKFNREIAAKLAVSIKEAETLRKALRAERGLSAAPVPLGAVAGQLDSQEHTGDGRQLDATTRQVMVDVLSTIAEELAREISLCFRYYTVTFRGKRVERAVFTGGEAYESILINVLKRQLAVEVEVAQPLKGFDLSSEKTNINFDSDRRGLLCEWAVAVGLGLKGWDGAKCV
jgi:type IV pilus assembly protein PilM